MKIRMNKAVFLDRDGTINEDRHYLYKKEDFVFLPGVIEGMREFQEMGFLLIIITNQSGIARGYYTEAEYKEMEIWMVNQLSGMGINITDVFYCPHLPNAKIKEYGIVCKCRKPGLGLFQKAVELYNIDVASSIAIGDKMRDLSVCQNGVTKGFLVYSNENKIENNIVFMQGGILQVANMIKGTEEYAAVDFERN